MRKPKYIPKTILGINNTYEAEPMEIKLRRITETNEPIEDVAPTIYTNKKDGVLPAYDIRTDRFQIAQDAIGKIRTAEAAEIAKSQSTPKPTETGESGGENKPVAGQS